MFITDKQRLGDRPPLDRQRIGVGRAGACQGGGRAEAGREDMAADVDEQPGVGACSCRCCCLSSCWKVNASHVRAWPAVGQVGFDVEYV